MKKRSTFVSLLAAAAALILALPNSITASAAGNSYVVHYDGEDWRWQSGSTWNSEESDEDMYYLNEKIKDGDVVVVDGSGDAALTLDVRLSNLTLNNVSTVIVTTKGIDECFVLSGSVAAINGNITNAYVYGDASVTFNNSITTLQILGTDDLNANVTVAGTVGHLIGKDNSSTYYDFYNVASGRMEIENGKVKTAEEYYSTTASGSSSQAQQTTPQQSTAQSSTPAASTQKPASSEYDDVPKTGESPTAYWLLGVAAVCLAGRYALRKA